MFETVKNWGVWCETVEITDVSISSGTLFKDMQTPHREQIRKEAEFYRMKTQSDIDVQGTKDKLEMDGKKNKETIERNMY